MADLSFLSDLRDDKPAPIMALKKEGRLLEAVPDEGGDSPSEGDDVEPESDQIEAAFDKKRLDLIHSRECAKDRPHGNLFCPSDGLQDCTSVESLVHKPNINFAVLGEKPCGSESTEKQNQVRRGRALRKSKLESEEVWMTACKPRYPISADIGLKANLVASRLRVGGGYASRNKECEASPNHFSGDPCRVVAENRFWRKPNFKVTLPAGAKLLISTWSYDVLYDMSSSIITTRILDTRMVYCPRKASKACTFKVSVFKKGKGEPVGRTGRVCSWFDEYND